MLIAPENPVHPRRNQSCKEPQTLFVRCRGIFTNDGFRALVLKKSI